MRPHNASIQMCLRLPKYSRVASTLAEAGAWPFKLCGAAETRPRLLGAPVTRQAQKYSYAADLPSFEMPSPPCCDAPIPINYKLTFAASTPTTELAGLHPMAGAL